MTLAIVACAAWALAPLERPTVAVDAAAPVTPPVEIANPVLAIDARAFEVELWNPRPAPTDPVATASPGTQVAPQPPQATQRRPALELVSILDDGGMLRAAVYDPATDRLLLVAAGDVIDGLTVSSISMAGVELSSGGALHRLALRRDR